MEEFYNPYDFVNPVKNPELFAGRKKELDDINYYLGLSRSKSPQYIHLALVGRRGSGKTSLLNMIKYMADKQSFLPIKVALNIETSKSDILFFKEVFDGIMTEGSIKGMYGGVKDKTYRFFRKLIDGLDANVEIPLLFGTAYISKRKGNQEAGISQHVLIHDLKELSNEAKKHGISTIVLLFDECDLLSQNEILLQKIRNAFMEVDGYILVFAGTEKMFPKLSEVFSPLPRFFKRINVENFKTFEETMECVLKPLDEEERKKVDSGSIQELHRLSGGMPYEVKLVCHFMYRRYKESRSEIMRITIDVLDDVLNELERLRKGEHHEIANKIKKCDIAQLKVLTSLFEFRNSTVDQCVKYHLLEDLSIISKENLESVSEEVKSTLEKLEKSGMIVRANGKEINLSGDEFDLLYLKYFATSKGIKLYGPAPFDSLINAVHSRFYAALMDKYEWEEQSTAFDRKIGENQLFQYGFKLIAPPGKVAEKIIKVEDMNRLLYVDDPNCLRFRVNANFVEDGFITNIRFKNAEDKEKLLDYLTSIVKQLRLIGVEIIFDDEVSYKNKGNALANAGKHVEAIGYYDKAIEVNPNFEYAWADKGLALMKLEGWKEAVYSFGKALQIHPRFTQIWVTKGDALMKLGNHREAIEAYDKALDLDPKNYDALNNKGNALLHLDKSEEAIRCYNSAINVRPNYEIAWGNKSSALMRLGKFEEARQCSEKALEINPKFVQALRNKGGALYNLGRIEESIECLNQLIEITPDDVSAWYTEACIESKRGNIDKAIVALKRVMEMDKEYISVIDEDTNFDSIRNDPRFKKLLEKMKQ